MKHIFVRQNIITILLLVLLLVPGSTSAQKWLKKARMAQVTVYAFDAKGGMKQSQGIFINTEGRVATSYDVMRGAVRASITDNAGREYPVVTVQGANSTYNIAVLNTTARKTSIIQQSPEKTATGLKVYILPGTKADKSATATPAGVSVIEYFNNVYEYCTLDIAYNDRQDFCPVVNENGFMIGLQQPASKSDSKAYVIDTRYAESLTIRALDSSNPDLRSIGIRKELPQDENEALSFLYLSNTQDTASYLASLKDFTARYPGNTSGYTLLADIYVQLGSYAQADSVYKQAILTKGLQMDEVYHSMAKNIYQLNLRKDYTTYADWDMNRAFTEAQRAYEINPLPIYTALEGFCLYSLKRFREAEAKYLSLAGTNMRSAEYFLYAAQCRQMKGDSIEAVIALQDSALSMYTRPYPKAAAPALIMRAESLAQAGRIRAAIADYNDYEHLMGSDRMTANFYYSRQQLEMRCRMYPAALNDIERAIRLSPRDPLLHAEEAATNFRVGQFQEAEAAARKATELDPGFADAWRILGIILRQVNRKAEGDKALSKAAELGDETAKRLLSE